MKVMKEQSEDPNVLLEHPREELFVLIQQILKQANSSTIVVLKFPKDMDLK